MTHLVLLGLGNPDEYRCTRHNIGKDFVEAMGVCAGITWQDIGKGKIGSTEEIDAKKRKREVTFVVSTGFMNNTGRDVANILNTVSLEKLFVVHDDADLPVGTVRLSVGGSAGGHKGVQSIIDFIGTEDFTRLRVGIGRGTPMEKFVLERFTHDEFLCITEALQEKVAETFSEYITCGVQRAMTWCNTK